MANNKKNPKKIIDETVKEDVPLIDETVKEDAQVIDETVKEDAPFIDETVYVSEANSDKNIKTPGLVKTTAIRRADGTARYLSETLSVKR